MPLIGVVVGSTRPGRVCPAIANHIHTILTAHAQQHRPELQIELVDLAAFDLPLYDEPGIPAHHPAADPTPHYTHAHTRRWSQAIAGYDAFVFVTPQYNWSVPAALKNALDFLYHEWARKPALIVAFGGHGGGKAAEHLRGVLTGLKMTPTAQPVCITIPRGLSEAVQAEGGLPDAVTKAWAEQGVDVALRNGLDEMAGQLASPERAEGVPSS